MEEIDVERGSRIIDSLIPNATEDPLAGPIHRLRNLCSSYALMARLDFPEVVCTLLWDKKIKKLSKVKITKAHIFFAPLCSLRRELSSLWAKWKGSESLRLDLLAVMTGYDLFIEGVCKAKKEERIQLLVGPARLYGWNRIWQLSQEDGRRLAGVDLYNQSSVIAKKGKRETKVGKKKNVSLKLLMGLNPPQADREFAVSCFARLVFGDCLLEREAIKLRDIWVADASAEISRGSDERNKVAKIRSLEKKSITEVFADHPKLKKKYKFLERRIESVVMACEVHSSVDFIARASVQRLDGKSLSTQFCLSLLVRPSRDKSENLSMCNGNIRALEYRDSLLPPVLMRKGEPILSLRSMLLILYRDLPLHDEVRSQLAKIDPEETILQWLHQIAQQNSEYEQSGIFSRNENVELGFPIMLSEESVSLTYRTLRRLKKACSCEGQITLGQLFKAVYPEVFALYERFAEESSNSKDQERLLFPSMGFCYPSDTLSKSDPVYKGLLKIGVGEPKKQDKKTSFELAQRWFREVPLDEFDDEECLAFLTKMLKLMPDWHDLRLQHSPLWYDQVVGILEKFPQIRVLSLERFSQTLTKDGLLDLGKAYPRVDIAIGECADISAKDLQDLAKAEGKFSILLGENTYQLRVADPNEILSAALELGATTVAEYCVLEGANLRQSDQTGATLLHRAAHKWPLKNLEFLLRQLKDVDPRDGQEATPFLLACARGDVAVIKLLKTHGASLLSKDTKGLTGLHHAVISGRPKAAKLLLHWGVGLDDLSDGDLNVLHLAVMAKQKDMVSIITECRYERVLEILDQGDRKEGATPLHFALRGRKRTEIVQLLVDTDCDVNVLDKKGSAPLHWAAEHGHTKSFKILLEAKADLCVIDAKKQTAVDIAIKKKNMTVLEAVIRSEMLGKDHFVVNDLVTWLLEQRKAGKAEAGELFVLGLCHELGRGDLNPDKGTAEKCFKEADAKGSSSAQYYLAKIMGKKGMFKTAFNLYTRAAAQGHIGAQYCLGLYFWEGTGCDHKEEQKAIRWFRSAAKGGHSEANVQMYNICTEGRGVKEDPWMAREYLQAAADAGHAEARRELERQIADD